MALIGKIRNHIWIVIVLVGLGLAGFIIMDMTAGQQSMFGSGQMMVGDINGTKVDINEFNRMHNTLYGGGSSSDVFAERNAVWNYYVEKAIVEEEAEAIGLGVSKEELLDLQFGNNLSPIIQARFADPNTGQVDRAQLGQFKQAIQDGTLDPSIRSFWAVQEREIIKERLKDKLFNLAEAAMYVPTWQAQLIGTEQNSRADFAYVQIPYSSINDADVTLSDADYQAYIKENMKQLTTKEETRIIEFLVFDVLPTAKDSANVMARISELVPSFEAAENDTLFVENNRGFITPIYVSKDDLPAALSDEIEGMSVGQVFGPYLDQNTFVAAKLIARQVVPDSVRSSHILIRANPQSPIEVANAQALVDSLKQLVDKGTNTFEELAREFGSDGTAEKGGDLDFAFQGQMVPEFNDLIFYRAEPGKTYTVNTQFGVHLVKITDRKFLNNEPSYRLAFVRETIIPSEETQRAVEAEARKLLKAHRTLDGLKTAVSANSALRMEVSQPLRRNDYQIGSLTGGQTGRDIVRFAFGDDIDVRSVKVGDVSPKMYSVQNSQEFYNERFVIAGLKSIRKAGKPVLADVKSEIEGAVLNRKKAELIKGRLEGQGSLQAIASAFSGATLDTARNVNFNSAFLPNIGSEPGVLGRAFSADINSVSKPVEGASGVFVLFILNRTDADPATVNVAQVRAQTFGTLKSSVRARLMTAMREKAEIEDTRSRFY
jgi:peptidyl-prolyl cis-trans isomerase D